MIVHLLRTGYIYTAFDIFNKSTKKKKNKNVSRLKQSSTTSTIFGRNCTTNIPILCLNENIIDSTTQPKLYVLSIKRTTTTKKPSRETVILCRLHSKVPVRLFVLFFFNISMHCIEPTMSAYQFIVEKPN